MALLRRDADGEVAGGAVRLHRGAFSCGHRQRYAVAAVLDQLAVVAARFLVVLVAGARRRAPAVMRCGLGHVRSARRQLMDTVLSASCVW